MRFREQLLQDIFLRLREHLILDLLLPLHIAKLLDLLMGLLELFPEQALSSYEPRVNQLFFPLKPRLFVLVDFLAGLGLRYFEILLDQAETP